MIVLHDNPEKLCYNAAENIVQFYKNHEELASENADLPDLFILTDAFAPEAIQYGRDRSVPKPGSFGLLHTDGLTEGDILFEDADTSFMVKRCDRILLPDLKARTDAGLVRFDLPSWYGSGYYMTVEVDSHSSGKLGKWETHMIYLYAENTAFAKHILIQNRINVDYILRVRYGYGFGGSHVEGKWLFCLSDLLNVKYYIASYYDTTDNWETEIRA